MSRTLRHRVRGFVSQSFAIQSFHSQLTHFYRSFSRRRFLSHRSPTKSLSVDLRESTLCDAGDVVLQSFVFVSQSLNLLNLNEANVGPPGGLALDP